jgi:DNA repair protein RecN (Recombination protein N)
MLTRLHIQNFALIEDLEIQWSPGMTAMTGETGSGKSIVLGAMGLVLGHRTDASSVRQGMKKCTIEATFRSNNNLNAWLTKNDYDVWPEIILRRELNSEGRSRAFINDSPVTAQELRTIGEQLVDLHGQDNTRLLLTREYQLHWIDERAGHAKLLNQYQEAFLKFEAAQRELAAIELEKSKPKADLDYIEYQLKELSNLELHSKNWTELEAERSILEHSTELRHTLTSAWSSLTDEHQGDSALDRLKHAQKLIDSAADKSEHYAALTERSRALTIELDDLAAELEQQAEAVEENPERLHLIQGWFDDLQHALHKHNVKDAHDLIQLEADLASRLQLASSLQASCDAALKAKQEAFESMRQKGEALMSSRAETAKKLGIQIQEVLNTMSMPNARLEFEFKIGDQPDILGIDTIEMLFSSNPGMSVLPLQKIASGGEKSRLMLAFKAVGHEAVSIPTIILDEIDTGVSGSVASKMAQLMKRIAGHQQVIAVTHLPQVAASADQHLRVEKEEQKNSTRTLVSILDQEVRIMEIASMLSGSQVSAAARENAAALIADNGSN